MKEWEELSHEETDYIWNEITELFKFYPSMNDQPFLELPEPFDIYNMHLFKDYLKDKSIIIDDDYYNVYNEYISNILVKCMRNDEYLYALNWQHTCFKYNPKSDDKMPHMIKKGGFNIYFPDYYPNGDYYFFVAKDLSWGYFTHPWTQQLWVFGKDMIEEIKKVPEKYLTICK